MRRAKANSVFPFAKRGFQLFACFWLLVSVWSLLSLGLESWRWIAAKNWQSASAQVMLNAEDEPLRYRYLFQGVEYEGGKLGFAVMGQEALDKREQELRTAAGESVDIWFNPKRPGQAVAARRAYDWGYVGSQLSAASIALLVGGGIFAGMIWYSRKNNSIAAMRQQYPREPWLWNPAWRSASLGNEMRAESALWLAVSLPFSVIMISLCWYCWNYLFPELIPPEFQGLRWLLLVFVWMVLVFLWASLRKAYHVWPWRGARWELGQNPYHLGGMVEGKLCLSEEKARHAWKKPEMELRVNLQKSLSSTENQWKAAIWQFADGEASWRKDGRGKAYWQPQLALGSALKESFISGWNGAREADVPDHEWFLEVVRLKQKGWFQLRSEQTLARFRLPVFGEETSTEKVHQAQQLLEEQFDLALNETELDYCQLKRTNSSDKITYRRSSRFASWSCWNWLEHLLAWTAICGFFGWLGPAWARQAGQEQLLLWAALILWVFLVPIFLIQTLVYANWVELRFDLFRQTLRRRMGFFCFHWQREVSWQQVQEMQIKPSSFENNQNNYRIFAEVSGAGNLGLTVRTERWVLLERLRREWLRIME